jgi:hypothetical protein
MRLVAVDAGAYAAGSTVDGPTVAYAATCCGHCRVCSWYSTLLPTALPYQCNFSLVQILCRACGRAWLSVILDCPAHESCALAPGSAALPAASPLRSVLHQQDLACNKRRLRHTLQGCSTSYVDATDFVMLSTCLPGGGAACDQQPLSQAGRVDTTQWLLVCLPCRG